MKKKRKIHKDKNGCNFIKESFFAGGKMKFRKVYVIDGMPAEEFYEKNATDLDHFINGEYWLMSSEKDANDVPDESQKPKPYLSDDETEDLPF